MGESQNEVAARLRYAIETLDKFPSDWPRSPRKDCYEAVAELIRLAPIAAEHLIPKDTDAKWFYEFAVWPHPDAEMPKAVHWWLDCCNKHIMVHEFTDDEFNSFRSEMTSAGFELREVSRFQETIREVV